MNEHKEARQTRCAHESTELCLHEKGNDLQAGKGRSLQDAEEKETLEGNGRRLMKRLTHFQIPPVSQKCHEFVTCSLCIALV